MMKVVPGCVPHEAQRVMRADGQQDGGVGPDVHTPNTAMVMNHTTVMGPKNLPMPPCHAFARQTGKTE
jgi:hypothetical protein